MLFLPSVGKFAHGNAGEHGGEVQVFVFEGITEAVAGSIEIREQARDVFFRSIAVGGILDCGKDRRQIGIEALVSIGSG